MSSVELPSYTQSDVPSTEIPSYTAQPRGGEQTLGLSRLRRGAHASQLRNWTKKVGPTTLTLVHQPADSELPVYGRQTTIEGFVTFDTADHVSRVQIKLEGYVKCKTIAEIGQSDLPVLNEVFTMYQGGDSPCPLEIPFELPLPEKYHFNGQSGPLPPSFDYIFYDVQGGTPGLKAKIKYELSVEVERDHPSLKERLGAALSTQFIYLPRSRPMRAPSTTPSSVFEVAMEHRQGGKSKELDPIVWKLRLPPPGTYSMTQPIPFRVTVTSRTSSLLTPFTPSNKKDKAAIRVYILRQVSIKVNTIDLWRTYVIGEGSLTYLPPAIDDNLWLKNVTSKEKTSRGGSRESVGSDSEREGWACHDWSGALKVDSSVSVGGFTVGDMAVKDFIVLSVVPPNPRLGSLLEVKRVVPIQLTTDGWDVTEGPPTNEIASDHTANVALNGYLGGRGDGYHVDHPRINGTNGHANGNGVYTNGNEVDTVGMN